MSECTCGGKGDDRFIHGPAYCGGRFVETPVSPPGQRGDARNAAEQAVIDAARDYCDDSLSGSPEAIQARYRVMREAVLALDGAK
jgi:hypothetical protein